MKSKNKKSTNKRAFVSIVLFIMFILLPVSGSMIGAMVDNNDAMLIWAAIHGFLGILFIIFGIFHIVYNWKTLKHYMIKK